MAGSPNVTHFTDVNFESEVLKSSVPVLVDFTATWCGPCRMLAPVVEALADEFAGRVKVGKLDIDANPMVTAKHGIRAVPTVLVFKNGAVIATHTGLARRDKLVEMLGL